MSTANSNYGIHCNSCDYEGQGKTNSSTTFMIFLAMICASAYFLPLIIAALAYMAWIIARPAQRKCPKCGSQDYTPLTEEQAFALAEAQKSPKAEQASKQNT